MKIIVLDGYTLNPGDLSWAGLETLGDCEIHDRTRPEDVVARAAEAEIVLTNKTIVNAAAIAALPDLRYLGVLATGYNIVDVAAARSRGIPVTNVPNYGTQSVAQLVFALLLELTSHVGQHARSVRDGAWSRSPDFCFWDKPLIELAGKTFGIVGFGRIGVQVAAMARAFGMIVIAHTRTPPVPLPADLELVDLDTLFRRSQVVSLHCPLTEQTRGLVNRDRLARMPAGAYLINTARGPLVDEAALDEALRSGALGGAGLDVLSIEPPPPDHPLLAAPRCVITPHVAWATTAARARLLHEAVQNVKAFLEGRPRNLVVVP
jgi:glycerate dehydrogenase